MKITSIQLLLLIVFSFISANATAQKQTPVVNHIAQYVVNLKTSTDFYMNIVGLDTIPEPFHDGRHTWFSIGSKAHLHLIQGAKEPAVRDKNSHLCFSVNSVAGYFKDPDGYWLEMNDAKD
jgi:lactoylglutathione lyase